MQFAYWLNRTKDSDSSGAALRLRQSKDQDRPMFSGRSLYSLLVITLIGVSYGIVLLLSSNRVTITPDYMSRVYGSEHWQLPPPYPISNGGGTAWPTPPNPHRSLQKPLTVRPPG